MDSDRLNRWLTLGANAGVLVGIALLVIELNQNRQAIKAQTRNDIAMGLVDILNIPAANPQVAGLIRRAQADEPLTPDEQTQFDFRVFALFRYWENVHYQYRQGLYDKNEYSMQRESWRRVLGFEANAVLWCDFRNRASAGFVEDIDTLLGKYTCNIAD